jgi:hypothetical protein
VAAMPMNADDSAEKLVRGDGQILSIECIAFGDQRGGFGKRLRISQKYPPKNPMHEEPAAPLEENHIARRRGFKFTFAHEQ